MTDLVTWLREQLDAAEREYRYGYQMADAGRTDDHMRAECHLCGWESLSGLESYVEDYWHEHADQVHNRPQMLADIDAKRRIIDLHETWPVLVETPPEFSTAAVGGGAMTLKMSRRIAWLTAQEYRERFGDEPPTAPVLRLLALPYAEHPDYRDEWRP